MKMGHCYICIIQVGRYYHNIIIIIIIIIIVLRNININLLLIFSVLSEKTIIKILGAKYDLIGKGIERG